jgi:hypothetical protein
MPTITTRTETQSFTATGVGPELGIRGRGAAFVEGTFVGTVVLECRPPGAVDFVPVLADNYGTPMQLSAPGTFAIEDWRDDVRYRWRCSAFTSGTILTGVQQA